MTDIAEELDRIGEEAYQERGKQAALVNLSFELLSAHLSEPFVDKETGQEKRSWVGVVDLGVGATEYWLDGAACGKQVAWLVANNKLPLRVRLIQNAEKKGNPYWLKFDSVSPNGTPKEPNVLDKAIAIAGRDQVIEALLLGDCPNAIAIDADDPKAERLVLQTIGVPLAEQAKALAILRGLANPKTEDVMPFEE